MFFYVSMCRHVIRNISLCDFDDILITFVTYEGSDESAYPRTIARAFSGFIRIL